MQVSAASSPNLVLPNVGGEIGLARHYGTSRSLPNEPQVIFILRGGVGQITSPHKNPAERLLKYMRISLMNPVLCQFIINIKCIMLTRKLCG